LKACVTAVGVEGSPAEQNPQLHYQPVTGGVFHSHSYFFRPFPVTYRPILRLLVSKNDGKKSVSSVCNWDYWPLPPCSLSPAPKSCSL